MANSLAEILLHHVTQQPQAPFVTDTATGISLTYAEASQRMTGLAQLLRRAGVLAGDRVALLLENSWHWPVAFLGAALADAIVVPLNTRWSAAELRSALTDCSPAAVVHDGRSAPAIDDLRDKTLLHVSDVPVQGRRDGILPKPDSVGAITYTSGTSGRAKGVMLTHQAMLRASLTYAGLFNSSPMLRTAVVVPLFHNTGFIDGLGHAIVAGGHLDVYRRFNAEVIARRISEGAYSYLIGVPTMYTRMLNYFGRLGSARAVNPWLAYAGAVMPPATVRRLRELIPNARPVNCYGMSEATSITHYMPHDLCDGHPEAVGIPVPGTLDRISATGELEVNSPTVMVGYWNDPTSTAAKLNGDWLKTGDLASRSKEGLITIIGRADDLINRGGEKVAPYEVESALCELPGIIEAAVLPIPHDDLGEIPVALVVSEPGTALNQQDIRNRLSERLADYKIPQYVFTVTALPKNANGKVNRSEAIKLASSLR